LVGVTLLATGRMKRDKPMPFGPYIAAAGWITLIWGQRIVDFYAGATHFG